MNKLHPLQMGLYTVGLTLLLSGINVSPKLIVCSIFMVLSLAMGLWMQTVYGRKNAFTVILSSIGLYGVGMSLMQESLYLYSFIPFGVACYVASAAFEKFKQNRMMPLAIFMALVSGVVVDGLLIAPWELMHFGAEKLPLIMVKGLSYKTFYAGLLSLFVWGVYDFKTGHSRFFRKF